MSRVLFHPHFTFHTPHSSQCPFTHIISFDSPNTQRSGQVGHCHLRFPDEELGCYPRVLHSWGECGLWTWWQMPQVHASGCFLKATLRVEMLADGLLRTSPWLQYTSVSCPLTGGRYYVTKEETEVMQEVVPGTSSSHSCLNSALERGGWQVGSTSAAFSQGFSSMWGWPAPPVGQSRIKADTETCFWVPQA